jgi:hypothetical protein
VIVRNFSDRIELITQLDHARLASQIIEHCAGLASRPRRTSILLATAEHDSGWIDVDTAPTVNPATGAVVDFISAPLTVRQGAWPRAAARLAGDPWAAALVVHHAITAYERYRSHPEWKAFFTEAEAARDDMRRAAGRSLDELADDYTFLRLGDLVSLVFCTGSTDEHYFADWTFQLSGARVVITPDAFAGAVVPVEIAAKTIERRRFQSSAELHDALRRASTATIRGEIASLVTRDRDG